GQGGSVGGQPPARGVQSLVRLREGMRSALAGGGAAWLRANAAGDPRRSGGTGPRARRTAAEGLIEFPASGLDQTSRRVYLAGVFSGAPTRSASEGPHTSPKRQRGLLP